MRLKQKIMMIRQADLAKSLAHMNVPKINEEVSTQDESNGESPRLSSPLKDLDIKVKMEDLRKTVKMEDIPYVKKENTDSDWTPKEDTSCKKAKRCTFRALPKVEYESESDKTSKKQEGKTHPTKNIAINYGKALVTFATSHIAIPYILEFIKDTNVDFQGFIIFVKANKNKVKSMTGIRSMVMVEEKDDDIVAGYKKVFQKVSEVFIKYFSVNWIIHSKLAYKMVYLQWRSKMLRRIQYPEIFSHINGFSA